MAEDLDGGLEVSFGGVLQIEDFVFFMGAQLARSHTLQISNIGFRFG